MGNEKPIKKDMASRPFSASEDTSGLGVNAGGKPVPKKPKRD